MPRAATRKKTRKRKPPAQFSVATIKGAARIVQGFIQKGKMPYLRFPQRSLAS